MNQTKCANKYQAFPPFLKTSVQMVLGKSPPGQSSPGEFPPIKFPLT